MKHVFIYSALLVIGLTSCQTKQEYFTKEQLLKKSDSLTAIRFEELEKQAAEDLDHRIAIEVKPKVDSILEGAAGILPVADERIPVEMPSVKPLMNLLPDSNKKDSL